MVPVPAPVLIQTKQEPNEEFGDYCRRRFQELMKSDPIFSINKQRMTVVIAEEWKQLRYNQEPVLQLPETFVPSDPVEQQYSPDMDPELP